MRIHPKQGLEVMESHFLQMRIQTSKEIKSGDRLNKLLTNGWTDQHKLLVRKKKL